MTDATTLMLMVQLTCVSKGVIGGERPRLCAFVRRRRGRSAQILSALGVAEPRRSVDIPAERYGPVLARG
jgi:hypothetical protein